MRKNVWLSVAMVLVVGMVFACEQNKPTTPLTVDVPNAGNLSMSPAGTAVTTIDWFGEDGEELCSGEFIIRVRVINPYPDYNWLTVAIIDSICNGQVRGSAHAYQYGPLSNRFKTAILNVGDYQFLTSMMAFKASWYIDGSGWESGGCLAFQPTLIVECPPDTTGGGSGGGKDPNPSG